MMDEKIFEETETKNKVDAAHAKARTKTPRVNRRLEALNALADIRAYARLAVPGELREDIVAKFNIVATYLGADKDWCV